MIRTLHSRTLHLTLLFILLAAGTTLRCLPSHAVHNSPDELNYAHQSTLVLQQGRAAFPILAADFRAHPFLPPPTRAGFLYLVAAVISLTGHADVSAGLALSAFASILALLLFARLAWRFFTPAVALSALTLYAASPLALATASHAWQESTVEALTLLLLLSAAELLRSNFAWHWQALFALTGAACITIKESATFAFLFFTAALLLPLFTRPRPTRHAVIFCALIVSAIALPILWLASLLGLDALLHFHAMAANFLASSPYSLQHESGSPLDLLHALFVISPLAALCFPIGVFALFRKPAPPQRFLVAATALFVTLITAATVIVPHHLNFRYSAAAFAPAYLLAGFGFSWAVKSITRFLQPAHKDFLFLSASIAILLFALGDFATYQQRFNSAQLQDLSIRMVLTGINR